MAAMVYIYSITGDCSAAGVERLEYASEYIKYNSTNIGRGR